MRGRFIAVVRLLRFLPSLFWRGMWIGFAALRYPPPERPLARAMWQMKSCKVFCRRLGAGVRVVDLSGIPGGATAGNGSITEGSAAAGSAVSAAGSPSAEPANGAPRALIAVANHTGTLDGWVLGSSMPIAFAAKIEMASWPIMGRIARNVGFVFVERGRKMETTRLIDEMRDRMRHGVRVLVFPEGTVGDGISLLPFKTGAFESVAGMEDGGVLPVYMCLAEVAGRPATEEERRAAAWPNGPMLTAALRALSLERPVYEVRIGRPIPTAGRDRKELAEAARAAMEALAG